MAQELACTTAQADAAVEAILSTIKASLREGEPVIVRRCGTWQVYGKRARVGRNPKTGAVAAMAARRVVRFTAGRPFKQAVDAATHRIACAEPRLAGGVQPAARWRVVCLSLRSMPPPKQRVLC